MVSLGGFVVAPSVSELKRAVYDLRERGLYEPAQWAAQQLVGVARNSNSEDVSPLELGQSNGNETYLLARTCFDLKDYRRCAHALEEMTDPLSVFLRCYATYLAGERQKEETRMEQAGPSGNPAPRTSTITNPELQTLSRELSQLYNKGNGDAFTTYLYGMVLADRQRNDEAVPVIVQAIQQYPCNWGAWQVLELLCPNIAAAMSLTLPNHWTRNCFLASLAASAYENESALQQLQVLSEQLPHSDWLASTTAIVQYQLRNFDEAQELFEDIHRNNPYSLTGMDAYSNILYVKEEFAALSHLAHHASVINKYSPETCCIIANYFSLKGAHEMAVTYFRRALRLQPHCVGAWVLMGHEFMELKNPQAAIESYRSSVDLCPRDFRAWYGLGQAYEMMQEPYYALYYFKRAAELRPQDARMWCAMAQCYDDDHLGQTRNAIRCYRRAVHYGDREGIALHKLAQLHNKLHEVKEAAYYYKLNLERMDAGNSKGEDLLEALLFLAHYHKDKMQLQEAEQYCQRLLDFGNSKHKEEAKELLLDISSMQRHGSRPPLLQTPGWDPAAPGPLAVGDRDPATNVHTPDGSVDMTTDEPSPLPQPH